MTHLHRRGFIALLPGALLTAMLDPFRWLPESGGRAQGHGHGVGTSWEHPEPRPDVDGSKVLTRDELDSPDMAALFDDIRGIPQVVDGIRCHCGCGDLEGYYSLLSCYEAPGMAQWCEICKGAGELAVRRTKEGQSLEQIRRAVDARWAPG